MLKHAANSPIPELMDEKVLNLYTNDWFVTRFCWLIPNVKELLASGSDKIKGDLTKAVINLRQSIDKNNTATKGFESIVTKLVRGHLDAWSLEFGYAQESQAPLIQSKKSEALKAYKEHQEVISQLNKNMGMRAACGICLMQEKQQLGINYLTIMHMLKKYEGILNQGLIKSDLLKYTISLHNELGQVEYAPIIINLTKELTDINTKVQTGLEKLPAGVLGKDPVKSILSAKLSLIMKSDDKKVNLIQNFEEVSQVYCKVNTSISTKLARICQNIEKANNIFSIAPSHKPSNDVF